MTYDNWLTEPLDAAQERHDTALLECGRDCFTESCDCCGEQAQNHRTDCMAGIAPNIAWHTVLDDELMVEMFLCVTCSTKFDDEERLG